MPESTKLDFDISESDLTAALMSNRSPGSTRATQRLFESNLKYYHAFLEAWTDSNDRVLDRAAARAHIAGASTSIEDQGRLVGQHTVEGTLQLVEEWARLSHKCLTLWASMSGAQNFGPRPAAGPANSRRPKRRRPAGSVNARKPQSAAGAFAAEVSEAGEPHTATEPGETTQPISSDGPGDADATGAAPPAGPANSRSPKRRNPTGSVNARKPQ